jgi:hypothetical protein
MDIRDCTGDETHRNSGDTAWDRSVDEMEEFILILHARIAFCGKSMYTER